MKNNSKQILLWGIKILAERYWGQQYSGKIDRTLIEKVQRFLPDAGDLLARLDAGYAETTEVKFYALQSIFTRVKRTADRKLNAEQYFHPDSMFAFQPLNLPKASPTIEQSVFANDAVNFNLFSIDSDSELLLNLLQKYGGFLPISNQPDCAMPLYEYIKIGAALAANPDGDFRLVVGDLSGIQDFIYTISSEKALKVLRARSFYLELLTKTLAHEICDDLELTSANIFFAGGGNFLLLLPESNDLDSRLEKYDQAINTHFLKQFEGNLHMPFASIKLANQELQDKSGKIIQTKWNRLFEKELSLAKSQKFKSLIANLGAPKEVDGKSCRICHADPQGIELNDKGYCPFCETLEEIGTILHKCSAIPIFRFKDENFTVESYVWPFASQDDPEPRIFTVNSIEADRNPLMFYCNYVTTKRDDQGKEVPATFEEMAKDALGAQRIATLAMDVDNMSLIFREGLEAAEFLIHAPTLSRMLDYFFKPGLKWICENPQYRMPERASTEPRNLAVIYSGGDDLLLAGGWNDVAEVAIDIQKNFRHFTCGNSDMGISGGLYVSNDSFPFYISVSKAKEAEKNYAKANLKKNSMVFFYDELTSFLAEHPGNDLKDRYLLAAPWHEVKEHILSSLEQFLANKLIKKIEDGKVSVEYSSGFIGKLYDMHDKYIQNPEGEIYLPDWVYHYSRLEKNMREKLQPIYEKFHHYDEKSSDNPIRYLPVVLNWLELLLRDKGE